MGRACRSGKRRLLTADKESCRSLPVIDARTPTAGFSISNFAQELATTFQAGNGFRRTGVGTGRPYARRIQMLTSEARSGHEIQDRLIDLYVQQDEARGEQNPDRARELQVEIDKATVQREEIRRRAPS